MAGVVRVPAALSRGGPLGFGGDGVELFEAVLGWSTFAFAFVAVATVGCLLAALVQVASGAGCYGGQPIPGGVTRRAEAVEARLRERYRPHPEPARPPLVIPEPVTVELDPAPERVPERTPLAA